MSIRKIAEEARERRLEGNRVDQNELPLHSYCFDNSYVLYTILKEKGYSPKIVEGTTDWYAEELVRSGVELSELKSVQELSGYVHYWVEVGGKFVDISSHSEQHFGEIMISEDLPDSYYIYDDSYSEAQRTLESARSGMCNYCGGRRNYCGCVEE